MKQNDKNNKIKKSNIDDRNISKDFSEIFDITENIEDIGSLFIDARVKKGLTQEDASKILKVRISAIKQIESGEELGSLGSAYRLGFLRSYAKLVDLDPENIIKNYKSSNSEKNIKFDYNFPSIRKEKKSLLPIIALCTFLFSLVIYSSWYYLNINDLENENNNITYLDDDSNNTFIGYNSGLQNTGEKNVAVGNHTIKNGSGAGSSNTALGSSALYGLTSGSNNIAIGQESLHDVTTGTYNIGIGNFAETEIKLLDK